MTGNVSNLAPVLSIDGGGIRGIIPAMLLAELERRIGRPTAEMFDLIAGTSTGGIIAIALTRPGADGRPARTAQQLVEMYENEAANIFASELMHSIRTMHGWIEQKYEVAGLESVLERYCGDSTLSQSLTDILIPAYDIVRRELVFFDSARAREDPSQDYPAKLVARATSAAPTYFEPAAVKEPEPGERVFVDGGLYANNPAMCAFAEAARGRFGRDILLVSLGTGELTRPLPAEEVRHWGVAQWARPILHIVLDGVSMAINHHLATILGSERYLRFQVVLTHANDDLDDVDPSNIANLKDEAAGMIDERSADLDRLAEILG